jgi:hypothetical protein
LRKLAGGCAVAALLVAEVAAAQTANMANPTCPSDPNWSDYRQMRFTTQDVSGRPVLLAEGEIDEGLIPRLEAALETFTGREIWLRSPGGNARVAKQADILLRQNGVQTRIPAGWACLGACNYLFMGGISRSVDQGGLFIVSRYPPVDLANVAPADRRALAAEISQQTALMASEDVGYLIRMGISRTLATNVLHAPGREGATRLCLTQEDMRRYNLVNQVLPPPPETVGRQAKRASGTAD